MILLFAAYGTASRIDVDYSPTNDRYLIAYTWGGDIYGQFVNADGTLLTDILISNAAGNQSNPSVAYNSANQRYLVAWDDDRNSGITGKDIYGQLIDKEGNLYGPSSKENFVISNAAGNQSNPSVAFDSANQRYLVAWDDDRNSGITGKDIYGQLVCKDGTLCGPASDMNFVISNGITDQYHPSVAYDTVNQRYLVAWEDYRNTGTTVGDIYGQLLDEEGKFYGTATGVNFVISNATYYQSTPSVAYDSANQRYLVAWQDYRNYATTVYDIYGQLIDKEGKFYGTAPDVNFVISNETHDQASPTVAYDRANQKYLVAWTDNRSATTRWDIYGQMVNADGFPDGDNFAVTSAPGDQNSSTMAYNSVCKNFLVAYWSGSTIGYSIVGPCSSDCLLGDINGDNEIDISDVILTLRMALGLDPPKSCPCPQCQ
jgi:hypothetical protein